MKKLLILSGKGGTGKTTTAGAFLRFSQAEAAADCDVDAPNLHMLLTAGKQAEPVDFMGADKAQIDPDQCIGCGKCEEHCRFHAIVPENGKCRVDEFACEGCGVCQLVCPEEAVRMVPDVAGQRYLFKENRVFSTAKLKMGRGNSGKLVTEVKKAMEQEAPDAKLAIIDGSPGIGCPVIASVTGVDLVLIVAEPSLSGLSDLQRIARTALILQVPVAVCVNKYDASPENARAIEDFCRKQKIPFAGKVPYDPAASAAINAGRSIADTACPAREALYGVYRNVMQILEEL